MNVIGRSNGKTFGSGLDRYLYQGKQKGRHRRFGDSADCGGTKKEGTMEFEDRQLFRLIQVLHLLGVSKSPYIHSCKLGVSQGR